MEIKLINLKESPVSKDMIIDVTFEINNQTYSGLLIKREDLKHE